MFRRITAALAALLLLGGLGLVGSSPAVARSVVPHHGSYAGVDHHGRMITFSFNGTQVTHFSINHQVLGAAHVSRGMWHETCHNGLCTKGSWTADGQVVGAWRAGGGSWVAFQVVRSAGVTPYGGTYMGSDHGGLRIHFSFNSGHLRSFNANDSHIGDAVANQGRFDVCHQAGCFKGHWETEYYVVGNWRPANSPHWRPFEAHAYAS